MKKSELIWLTIIPFTLLLAACEEEATEVNQGVHFSEKTAQTSTSKNKPEEKVISLQYAVQSKDGIQLKDFKKEYKRDVFSDDVFFKESANAQAKLTVTYVGFSIDKIIFALPKEDLEQILSRLQD